MAKDRSRPRRVAALLKRELSLLVRTEVEDAGAAHATITDVDVAPDLSHAKVYVTHLKGMSHARKIVGALNRSSGALRHALAGRIQLRVVPELRFHYDESVEKGMAISKLIDEAIAKDRKREK